MEKGVLIDFLDQGLSCAEIGRRVGRAPSTVEYWLRRHGLTAAYAERHAARGGLDKALLSELVARDMTIREIAVAVDRSPATVQHWLRRHGLRTTGAARGRPGPAPLERTTAACVRHGQATHVIGRDGTRTCVRCRANSVGEWRRRAKQTLLDEAGGACVLCGFSGVPAALHFHHVDPAQKRFGIGGRGLARSLSSLREEVAKCVLLCANCHAAVESGVATVPTPRGGFEPPRTD